MDVKVNKQGLKEAKWEDRKGNEYTITEPKVKVVRAILQARDNPDALVESCIMVWKENLHPTPSDEVIDDLTLEELQAPIAFAIELATAGVRKNLKRARS